MTEVLRELPAGRRIGAGLAESAAIRALDRIEHGALELRLPSGRVHRSGTGDPIVVTVTSNDVFRRLARSPGLGFGESYAAGDWHTGMTRTAARAGATITSPPTGPLCGGGQPRRGGAMSGPDRA